MAIAPPITCRVSVPSARSSGIPRQSKGRVDHPPAFGSPGAPNEPGSNVGWSRSSPAREENGTLRLSRWPRVLAVLTRIRKIQVRNEDRPSNPSRPLRTPSHASWTTSSATVSLETYIRATRRIDEDHERGLVAGAQALDEGEIIRGLARVGHELQPSEVGVLRA